MLDRARGGRCGRAVTTLTPRQTADTTTRRTGRYVRLIVALVAVGVSWLVLADSILASRAPSKTEASAIRHSVARYVSAPRSPAGQDATVVSIAVSTVDPHYAAVRLTSKTRGRTVMVLHYSFGVWWLQQVGASLGCDTAPKVVLNDLRIACRGPDGLAWISDCSRLEGKPTSIVISCADDNYALLGLRWQSWGTASATAAGTARVNDCTPYCAAGHFHDYRVTVSARNLTKCGATPVYAQLTVTYTASRPKFFSKHDRHRLGC